MQGERRTSSLLECYAEPQLFLCEIYNLPTNTSNETENKVVKKQRIRAHVCAHTSAIYKHY